MDRDEYYSVSEAAKVLGKGERWVRQLASNSVIEGERKEDGWQLLRRSVHEFRDSRPASRGTSEAAEWPPAAREALSKVETLQRELGRLEGRLQITEVAESTLRDQLERERERADEERQRADGERDRANQLEEKAEKLRDELEAERSRGFWARLFGG
jgi:chromosome segregation ATPase